MNDTLICRNVAVCGCDGTGKTSGARGLARRAGLGFTSTGDIFREMARERNVSAEEMERIAERNPEKIDREIEDAVSELFRTKDGIVIDGRLAYRNPKTLKILVVCDFWKRVERIASRAPRGGEPPMDYGQALAYTIERERLQRLRFWQFYEVKDFTDPRQFHAVVNTTYQTEEEEVDHLYQILTGKIPLNVPIESLWT